MGMAAMTFFSPRRSWREASGLYLNVGCGPDGPPEWINIDRSPHVLLDRFPPLKWMLHRTGALADAHMEVWPRNIIYRDVCRGLPLPDGSAAAIYSSHMLEHLYFDDARKVLHEFRRLISPAGIVRLALPDAEKLASDFLAGLSVAGAEAAMDFNRALSAHPLTPPSGLARLTSRLGASAHRWQPTRQLVTQMMIEAGFGRVSEREFMCGELPNLELVEHRAESFFVEARVALAGGPVDG